MMLRLAFLALGLSSFAAAQGSSPGGEVVATRQRDSHLRVRASYTS